ncbi:unnamed protein product [Urochloa humidicola]
MDIVVGALSAMVDALPGKLGALLEQEYGLPSGVHDDVRFLQVELGSMRPAVRQVQSLDDSDAQSRAWVGRVREVAYDVEDWVDLFVLRVDAGRGAGNPSFPRFLRRQFHRTGDRLRTRRIIGKELKDLKERVVELSEQRKRYSLGALRFSAMARPLVDVRVAALFVDTGNLNLVGLDGPIEEVTKMATDAGNKDELRVVSIVGMAGSGKTTLAHAVFRRLQVHFHCSAFVSVGQKPDMCRTLQDMLFNLGGVRRRGGEDIHQLIISLREMLQDKRYLIVVDDLWSSEQWATIRCCLLENNTRSSVITTSRNDVIVSSGYGSANHVYKIGLLGDADARKLFLKRIFGTGHDCPQHLQDVCAKIMRRCGGLPLALISVASILANKQSRHEWEKLGSNSLWSSHTDVLKQIINLSYNDLMPHLRTCMLYLSIFPVYYELEVERLLRRWIAEGFIIGEARSTSVEDRAIDYLNELINRNMVQPLHLNHDGVPRYCKVHPIIHDFIVNKSVEENFVTLVDTQDHHYDPNNNNTVRRLSVQSSSKGDQTVAQYATDLSHARSVTVFGQANTTPKLTDLKVLRVLDLQDCDGPVCLDGLGKLILLRYLNLRGTDICDLPQTIGELRCLETLDVRSTKVKELPSSIVSLEKLMHLLSGSAKLPREIVKMKALQTLSCAIVAESHTSTIEEISRCAKLRELEMFCDTEMPGEARVVFPHDGFQSLKQLRIWCSLASVNFGPGVLPTVQMLELMFEGARADESSGVLGIDNLPNLKYVLIDFSKHGAGTMATVDAVRKAADRVNRVIIKVEGKSY